MSDSSARMESSPVHRDGGGAPGDGRDGDLRDEPGLQPVHVSIPTVCVVGSLAWLVVLVVTLAVPVLHTGQRSWWPWTAVVGLALGVGCWLYVRRGRGNAAGV